MASSSTSPGGSPPAPHSHRKFAALTRTLSTLTRGGAWQASTREPPRPRSPGSRQRRHAQPSAHTRIVKRRAMEPPSQGERYRHGQLRHTRSPQRAKRAAAEPDANRGRLPARAVFAPARASVRCPSATVATRRPRAGARNADDEAAVCHRRETYASGCRQGGRGDVGRGNLLRGVCGGVHVPASAPTAAPNPARLLRTGIFRASAGLPRLLQRGHHFQSESASRAASSNATSGSSINCW
jgi:hypothetical protein